MIRIKLSIFSVLAISLLIAIGCSGLRTETGSDYIPKPIQRVAANDEPDCPIIFEDTPDVDMVLTIDAIGMRNRQIASFLTPVMMYRMANGTWPQSWDDLKTGYLVFLPVDPVTGKEFVLLNYSESGNRAPANAVVADWRPDGCEIYIATPGRDGWNCGYLMNSTFQLGLDIYANEPGKHGEIGAGFDDPVYRFMQTINTWMITALAEYDNRTGTVPGTKDALLEGFIINPDYNPGYVVNDETGAGRFTIATYPEEDKYYFKGIMDNPRQVWIDAFTLGGEFFMKEINHLHEEPVELYTVLLTEQDFLN